MARNAKLRNHNGYWYTKAGNPNGVDFGPIDKISFAEAQKEFRRCLATLAKSKIRKRSSQTPSVAILYDRHLT